MIKNIFLSNVTPIENIIQDDNVLCELFRTEYLNHYKNLRTTNLKSVQWHKTKLGKQEDCFSNGEFRFWVWSGENWTCLVSNKKGICFEVKNTLSPQQAYDAWKNYLSNF